MSTSASYIWPATGATPPTSVNDSLIVDIVASADGDTTITVPHLMGVAPQEVYITPLLSQALTALSGWVVSTINTTNIILTKLASTGSGNAAAQLRLIVKRPHSIGR